MTYQPGDRVRMTEAYKAEHRHSENVAEHIAEFGDCVGVIIGLVQWGNGAAGPELDVRWEPSGLRYMYEPEELEHA